MILTISIKIWRCSFDKSSPAVWASCKHCAMKEVARHTLTFGDVSNNPENTKKASISVKYPSPSISFPPCTSPSSAGEKLKHHFKPPLLFAPFGPAPEVLHSVRTCNVDSISAAIRPHPLQKTCLFVIPPPALCILHVYPRPPPLPPSVFILLSLYSSSNSSSICPPIPSYHRSIPSDHPGFSPPFLSLPPSIHFSPLHSHPQPCPQGSTANCLFNNRPP